MLRDARSVSIEDVIDTDVCIIGGGPAGITLARELDATGRDVLVLESGAIEFDKEFMTLADGESVGRAYYPLFESRARAFGGSSHLWPEEAGLRSRPMDPIDFVERPEIPYSGWPISYEDLIPFYDLAHGVCGLGEPEYRLDHWERPDRQRLRLEGTGLHTQMFRFGRSINVFRDYLHELNASTNVVVMHHANVVEIVPSENGTEIENLAVAGLWNTAFTVRARHYVLAAGGIENARLLLASNSVRSAGIGNEHDLVGRFFMEHLHVQSGLLIPKDEDLADRIGLYARHRIDGWMGIGVLAADRSVLQREGILNNAVYIRPASEHATSGVLRSLAILASAAKSRGTESGERIGSHLNNVVRNPRETARVLRHKVFGSSSEKTLIQMVVQGEQAPNPESRITLSDKLDPLGFPRAQLDWRLTDLDHRSVRRIQELVDQAVRRAGIGRVERLYGEEYPPAKISGHWHHMGTTRMHDDPLCGVVDRHCRVHGISNLFVAGSSVFPTGGFVNPTLTIVALTLRLADHLKRVVAV